MDRRSKLQPRSWVSGAAMLEFSLIGPMFFIIVLTVMQFGFQLFNQVMLDRDLSTVVRQVRLGLISSTSDNIKSVICQNTIALASCQSRLTVNESSGPTLADSDQVNGQPGTTRSYMIVSANYTTLSLVPGLTQFSWFGSGTLVSTSVFQNEPY